MKSPYKYTIVGTLPIFEEGRRVIRYRLMTKTTKKEVYKVVALGALSTMYHDGLIEGYIDQYIKMKLGLPRRKIRSDRKRPVVGGIEKKWNLADEWVPDGVEPVSGYDEINVPKEPPYKDKPVVSNWAKLKEEMEKPKVWNLADEFKVEQEQGPVATGRAYYIEKDGRYCVVLPDGTLDDEWTNLMMAEIYRDSLNKEKEEGDEKGS